jgi:ABC-type amino acid transport system permease subunit
VALVAYFAYRGRGIRLVDPAGFLQPIIAVILIALLTLGLVAFLGTENNLRALQAAIAGLAFAYGAFLAELFRAGIQSIPRGQMEASRSLGMTYVAAMRYVILPQAFRVILPPLGNEFIAILKDTSLIAILALPDMTQMARLYATDTYRPFEPYLTIAVLYLCMTLFLSFMVRVVERRVSIPR